MSDTPPLDHHRPGPPPVIQPVTTPPGPYPPGPYPPGAFPPGAYPPGTYAPQPFGPPPKTGRNLFLILALSFVGLVLIGGAITAVSALGLFGGGGRKECGNNLKRIGEGLILYSNENNSRLPRTDHDRDSPVALTFVPTGAAASDAFTPGKPVGTNNVSAALFLLLRTQDLGPETFICPSSSDTPDRFNGSVASNRANFTASTNFSYALANPYPDAVAVSNGYRWAAQRAAGFVLAGDRAATSVAPTGNPAAINSPNHKGQGQSVLFGDFHWEFVKTPTVGIGRDNIYFPNGPSPKLASVPNLPGSIAADDSFLLPRK